MGADGPFLSAKMSGALYLSIVSAKSILFALFLKRMKRIRRPRSISKYRGFYVYNVELEEGIMENTVRLQRKNETILKIMIIISVLRMILSVIDKGSVASTGWMIVQIILYINGGRLRGNEYVYVRQ